LVVRSFARGSVPNNRFQLSGVSARRAGNVQDAAN